MVPDARLVRARVFLVEDNAKLCTEFADYMRRLGHEVATSSSVQSARETLAMLLARALPPHVMLCDVCLSDGDAGDIYLEFEPQLPGSLWVFMSGYIDRDSLRAKIGRLPAPRVVLVDKPVSLRTLRQLIDGGDTTG